MSFTCLLLRAQDTVYLKKEARKSKVITDRPPQVVYAELGGPGIAISVNYDRRFNKKTDGLGMYAGLGYGFSTSPSYLTVPVGVNYLLGKNGKYFEMGAGLSYLGILSSDDKGTYIGVIDNYYSGKKGYLLGTMTFGYRRQPINGGFNFRVGLSPFIGDGIAGVLPYIGVGYNF